MRALVLTILLVACALTSVEAHWGHRGWGHRSWGRHWGQRWYRPGWPYYPYNPYYQYYPYVYGKRELLSAFEPSFILQNIPNVLGLGGICKLFINETTLSCVAPKGLVECPVVFNSTFFNTTAFGLGKMTTMNYTTTPSDKQQFSIFPRSEENTNWLNSTLMFNSTLYNLALYTTNATATCGIRVVDPACFADLGSLFHSIEVEDDMFGAITLI